MTGRWTCEIRSVLPGGNRGRWSGTSMSAPVVAGQVALVRSAAPTLRRQDIDKVIRDTARRLRKARGVDLLASLARAIEKAD